MAHLSLRQILRYVPHMRTDPTLIIQLQRMGDLILTFPLLARLRLLEPDRPLWVVAEPRFFRELMPLTPQGVVYMGPDMAGPLRATPMHRVINISHRPNAAALAGSIAAPTRLGAFEQEGSTYIKGAWPLYRQSIVHNNRHNRFHWADLHALGLLDPTHLLGSAWPRPQSMGKTGKIGLFVGASEVEKRPDPAFWGELAQRLFKKGLNPVFLGGPDDRGMADQANRLSGLPGHNNLAGHFSLSALTTFVRTLDLIVTPDTGPMHLSAWAGVPVLNLSMGPVNAWETGPVPPGHLVVRPTISCTGCWQCTRSTPCRRAFVPGRLAVLIAALERGDAIHRLHMPGLVVSRTTRVNGLYHLEDTGQEPQSGLYPHQGRASLDLFWQDWFLQALGGAPSVVRHPMTRLDAVPHLRAPLVQAVARIYTRLSKALRQGGTPLSQNFWQDVPPLARPLSGYLHLLLQNGEYGRTAWNDALTLTAHLNSALENESSLAPVPLVSTLEKV